MERSVKISAVIIAYNEEDKISACLTSLWDIVDEIVVVDSFSSDNTKAICQAYGVRFIQNKFEGFIEQKNFAVSQALYDHILYLDADERLSEKMSQSVLAIRKNWKADAYEFNRSNYYCGKWLKYSWYPDRKIRLWDRRKAVFGGLNPHEKVIISKFNKVKAQGDILHYAYSNLDEHLVQIRNHAITAAESKYKQGKKANFFIHVVLDPLYKFFRKYILHLGFLDGYYGFIFCCVSSYLNLMKYARLWEMQQRKPGMNFTIKKLIDHSESTVLKNESIQTTYKSRKQDKKKTEGHLVN